MTGAKAAAVAPYVGAWIETILPWSICEMVLVAPYVGAWIETLRRHQLASASRVAPYVGAWIETNIGSPVTEAKRLSHPMWVRGLKQYAPCTMGGP